MIKTQGLTHIGLAVRDPDGSLRFYSEVFGVKEYYRDSESIQRVSRLRGDQLPRRRKRYHIRVIRS